MNRWERAFRRLLFCLLGAPLALADGGVFQFIAANPHGPPPNGLLNPALLKGGGAPGSGHKPKKSGKWQWQPWFCLCLPVCGCATTEGTQP